MHTKQHQFHSFLSSFDFGHVTMSTDQISFNKALSDELIYLCRSLPMSMQISAFSFLMKYSRISFDSEFDFFRHYYTPAWSIIYWLSKSDFFQEKLKRNDIQTCLTAHSMAMFLHSLDDHLSDGQISVSHLVLLLRSQAWCRMKFALTRLSHGVDGGSDIIQNLINDYYGSICDPIEPNSLDDYCDAFLKQMATWWIVPVLITKKIGADLEFTECLVRAYGCFGIAWRLLDDIKDIEKDMIQGQHSSAYICLPTDIRKLWDHAASKKPTKHGHDAQIVLGHLIDHKIVERIMQRIFKSLRSAASIMDSLRIPGLAHEFRCLLKPLAKFQGTYY